MKNYTFIKPYKTTIGSKDEKALLLGASPFQEINFKIGDKINGTPFGGVDTNKIVETRVGNANLNIPPEYLKEEAEKQPVAEAQSKSPTKEVLSQDKEDNFYRSLGFTTSGMIKPKVKGRFFVALVLVGGYFAYKKFKK